SRAPAHRDQPVTYKMTRSRPTDDDSAAATSIEVADDLAGQRLDRALAAVVPGLSRTRAQAAIMQGRVTVSGLTARPSLILAVGMRIAYTPERPSAPALAPALADLPNSQSTLLLRIVYEDPHLLVVDKPAGLVIHPAPGHPTGTLVDVLRAY